MVNDITQQVRPLALNTPAAIISDLQTEKPHYEIYDLNACNGNGDILRQLIARRKKSPSDLKSYLQSLKEIDESLYQKLTAHLLPSHTFADLMARELPPIRWIVPEMIPEGMTILAGKQKVGKSWLLLELGLSVSSGGVFLGSIEVEQRDVLYLALEDNERRLKDRFSHITRAPEASVPSGFHYVVGSDKWPRLDVQGLSRLHSWLDAHPTVQLVIVDTWGKAKPISRAKNGYDADVEAASGIQTLAMERNISVLVISHLTKAAHDYALDELNATTGLSATADNILILKRQERDATGFLYGTGREIDLDKALSFQDAHWSLLGDAESYRNANPGGIRQDILTVLKSNEMALTMQEIADAIEKPVESVKTYLRRMLDDGQVKREGRGMYTVF